MRLSGRNELRNDSINEIGCWKKVEQNFGKNFAEERSLFRSKPANAIKENRHSLHRLHQKLGIGVDVHAFEVVVVVGAAAVVVHSVHASEEKLEGGNDDHGV